MAKIGYLYTEEELTAALRGARAVAGLYEEEKIGTLGGEDLCKYAVAQNRTLWRLIEMLADGEEVGLEEEDAKEIFGEEEQQEVRHG